MKLTFLGAASTVTGSQFLLETKRAKILVDCGMFQGNPREVEHDRVALAYDPSTIDALLLTHAHLDHCGLIPFVVARGLRAPIFATAGTVELAEVVLLDSAKLQEEFADRGETTIDLPLYTVAQAEAAIRQLRAIGYDKEIAVAPGVRASFFDAGHILGSAMIRVIADDGEGTAERVIVFSGDIGRPHTPIIRDPSTFTEADYVLMESTYGGREHEPEHEALAVLAETVRLVQQAKGVLLVPSFAIGRTQEVVYQLDRLLAEGKIRKLPVFLDSPMASKATEIYRRHAEYFDAETRALLARRDDPLDFPGVKVTKTGAESRKIKHTPRPYMIVASNGMLTGGRVLHHLRELIDDPAATILFVGYQGQGTLGAHLQAGAKEVRLDGQMRSVHCQVRSISGFSAHADESELLEWARVFTTGKKPGDKGFPRKVFIVHGDPDAEAALAPKLQALGFTIHIPRWREVVELG